MLRSQQLLHAFYIDNPKQEAKKKLEEKRSDSD